MPHYTRSSRRSRSAQRPRSLGRIVASAATLTLCTAACKLETKAIPATQIVVDIEADALIRDRARTLELTATGNSGIAGASRKTEVLAHTLRTFESAFESSAWPVRLVFAPRENDPSRTFELTATANDARGSFIAHARVRTGFRKNEIRHAVLRLTRACLGINCRAGETCREGMCEDAWRTPNRLPLFPARPVIEPDAAPAITEPADAGALDASFEDASATDASAADATIVDASAPPMSDAAANVDAEVDAGLWVDRCLSENGGCDPRVVCLDTLAGVLCGACPNGFIDVAGDGTRCDDVDECARRVHDCDADHGTCANSVGSYECSCADGFFGDGRLCKPNVPCGADPAVCDAMATCTEQGAARVCVCGPGYQGNGGTCSDVDECASSVCPAPGICTNTPGSFTCACAAGFVLQNGSCIDVDECAAGTDDCDDDPNACVNTPGGYTCTCPAGFRGVAIGTEGCDDINECRDNTDRCPRETICENHRGTFSCNCDPGFSGPGIGPNPCSDIDECATGRANCSENASCENTEGSYECRCRPGFTGNGRRCEPAGDD